MIQNSLKINKPVIGVAVGSGLFAKQAVKGGADLLLALSAGRFRSAGIPSIGCMMPFANSNELVFDFSSREILPKLKDRAVICGINATDPNYSHEELIQESGTWASAVSIIFLPLVWLTANSGNGSRKRGWAMTWKLSLWKKRWPPTSLPLPLSSIRNRPGQ